MPKKKTKQTFEKNQFIQTVIGIFKDNPFSAFNYKQVAARLGLNDRASRDYVRNILAELYKSKVIEESRRGKYKIGGAESLAAATRRYITGRIDMKQTGKAYLISDEMKEDVFIAPNNTHHALDGDTVKVFLLPRRKGRKTEGEVVEILERKKNQFVGIVEIHPTYAFLIPDNPNMIVDIFIPKDKLNGARHKEKAICQITEWPDHAANPFGEIIDVLGKPGENDVEMKSILAEFEFPLAFPEKVEKDAAKIPMTIPAGEYKKRKDFRDVWTITIDPADAKDFDDAISFRKLPDGICEIGVHIADVSYYVKPGTPLDQEAYKRGTSIYLVDRVVPMLPEKLSNELCSLKEKEEKLCFAAVFKMNEEADVLEQWIGRTVIRSVKRFNYDEVQEIIEQKSGLYVEEIGILDALAKKLREKRFKGGSFNFESQEVKFKLDEQGKPLGVYIREMRDANRLIEDFMLLANRTVAEYIGKKKGRAAAKTFVYRVHDTPNEEKLELFATFVGKLGYKINIHNRKMLASSFNKLFDQVKGKGEQNLVETVAVRTMAKAYYSTKNIGHYGLGFTFYTHFTSPIRRYPDLMVHRLLESYIADGPSVSQQEFERQCEHTSEMERRAESAERASVKYKQAEYLLDKIGQEFEGLISGVSKWGIFVEIVGNKCEGMVRLRDMIDDFYYLDEENYTVIGQRYKNQYRLGDQVRIRVKRIDLPRKQMDFEMLS